MIGIKVNNEFLDLPPDAEAQTERNTPLILSEENLGELTFPITLKPTERNIRLLGFITELGRVKGEKEVKIQAEYYEFGLLLYTGTLVAEYVTIDLNRPQNGEISVYFLTAISSFYSAAQKVMLHQIDLGGDRLVNDFRAHAASTWSGTALEFDYVFAPVKNDSFAPDPNEEPEIDDPLYRFMNPVTIIDDTLLLNLTGRTVNRIMPFIYYRYLLVQSFRHFGYTIGGDFLSDPGFIRCYGLNFNAINWGYFYQELVETGEGTIEVPHVVVNDPVVINLKNHVPRNYSVTKFLFSLANRLGIAYHIDTTKKHCTIRRLNTAFTDGVRKDYTLKCNPTIKEEFPKQKKIYAIKQNFDPADNMANTPDLSQYRRLPDADTLAGVPVASPDYDKSIIYVVKKGWFYVCETIEDTNEWEWKYLADNIYDYDPNGSNETIETNLTPVAQRIVPWRTHSVSGLQIAASFPQVDQTGNWQGKTGEFVNWDLRILFFHGMQVDSAGASYPYSSSHNYAENGTLLNPYSLFLQGPEGLFENAWKNWLAILQGAEVVDLLLYLNLYEFRALSWTDIILIRNVPFLITQQNATSPYTNQLPCKAIRINTTYSVPSPVCLAEVGAISIFKPGPVGTVSISWVDLTFGAVAWTYSIDGAAATLVYIRSVVITGLSVGAHTVTIVPYCGQASNNPAGSATQTFDV